MQNGNSAKFRPDSQNRTSDSDSATKKLMGVCQNLNRWHFQPKFCRPVLSSLLLFNIQEFGKRLPIRDAGIQ